MKRSIVLAALLTLSALPTIGVSAQEDCATGMVCVEYGSVVLEVDPADGEIQYVVVETTVITVTDFAGQKTRERVVLLELLSDGDQFSTGKEITVSKAGVMAGADLGDSFGLQEIVP